MKKRTTLLTIIAFILAFTVNAQVAINDDGSDADESAKLDIVATDGGILIPRMNQSERDLIVNPATGLLIFQTNDTPGFYYNAGTAASPSWIRIGRGGDDWSLTGNAGTNSSTNFIGTTNAIDFVTKTGDEERMRVLSDGRVVINNGYAAPFPYSADKFSVVGNDINWSAINGYSNVIGGTGVYGSAATSGDGVYGTSTGGTETIPGFGVFGNVSNANTHAVVGVNSVDANASTSIVAISGAAGSSPASLSLLDAQIGVTGTGNNSGGIGVAGFLLNGSTSSDEVAGYFEADFDGDENTGDGPFVMIAGYDDYFNAQFGIQAFVPDQSNNTVAIEGVYSGGGRFDAVGVIGDASSANPNYGYGVIGYGNWYGVYAGGDLGASGLKTFVIDYPLEPENKFLKHFSIESDEVLLQYRGVEVFDNKGEVIVELPEYYSIINKNASYQLTPIGAPMPSLYIKRKVDGSNTFVIAGGVPGKEVSWVVLSERNDPYVNYYPDKKNNIIDKKENRGKYLMPELYGQSVDKRIIKKAQASERNNYQKTLNSVKSKPIKKESVTDSE